MKSSYTDSLAHTTFECKYHIVFASKFRRKEIYGTLRREIGMILRELCNGNRVFWCRGYYVSTVENQLKKDMM